MVLVDGVRPHERDDHEPAPVGEGADLDRHPRQRRQSPCAVLAGASSAQPGFPDRAAPRPGPDRPTPTGSRSRPHRFQQHQDQPRPDGGGRGGAGEDVDRFQRIEEPRRPPSGGGGRHRNTRCATAATAAPAPAPAPRIHSGGAAARNNDGQGEDEDQAGEDERPRRRRGRRGDPEDPPGGERWRVESRPGRAAGCRPSVASSISWAVIHPAAAIDAQLAQQTAMWAGGPPGRYSRCDPTRAAAPSVTSDTAPAVPGQRESLSVLTSGGVGTPDRQAGAGWKSSNDIFRTGLPTGSGGRPVP